MTYYLIYKITNKVNGKIYIGQHMTDNLDDGYMGSGIQIRRAIKKHGVENFSKDILYFCTDVETMNIMEEIIVNEEFIARKDTYNMAIGGQGGPLHKGHHHSDEAKKKISETKKGSMPWNKGKTGIYSEETKRKIGDSTRGKQRNPEAVRKTAEANKGKHHTEEYKKRMSDFRKRNPTSGMTGKHHSEETKKKMSEIHKAKVTEEDRQKVSERIKLYWQKRKMQKELCMEKDNLRG